MSTKHLHSSSKFLRPISLHIWLPDIFDFKGGIQVYSAFLLKALQNTNSRTQFEVFLKNDHHQHVEFPMLAKTNFHFSGHWQPSLRTIAFLSQILSFGIWQRPNLIIASHLNFAVAAYWLKRITGTPYWAIAHGIEAWNIQDPRKRIALQNADKILAVSGYTRSRLILEQNLEPHRVAILSNTVDAGRFNIRTKPNYLLERYGLNTEQPIILTVSRLVTSERYKGYEHILRALPTIRQTLPNVHYIIAGKGNDQPRIEQIVEELNLQDCVTLAGFVPDDELCDYYNLCDLFAMPSKREGFGIVYLEALACGKPTLAGNKDGAADALLHGELGVLIDPDNIDQIAQATIQILKRSYSHPIIYKPEILREKVLMAFGFHQFQQTLTSYLQEQLQLTQHFK